MRSFGDADVFYREFVDSCDEMLGSKFILADVKIANILKSIAAQPRIADLFAEMLTGFDFNAEFSKCKTPNSFNRTTLRLPASKNKFVALAFVILADFDAKRRNLMKFLDEFFHCEEGLNESYSIFLRSVIAPLKHHTIYLLSTGAATGEVRTAEEYFDASGGPDDNEQIPQNEIIAMVNILREIINSVSSNNALNIAEREEILTVTDGLSNAIVTRNDRLVKIMWIGFKNTLRVNRLHEERVLKMSTMLNKFFML